jgi:hypothetical protein
MIRWGGTRCGKGYICHSKYQIQSLSLGSRAISYMLRRIAACMLNVLKVRYHKAPFAINSNISYLVRRAISFSETISWERII